MNSLNLGSKKYNYGSYRRESFLGYNLYSRFEYADFLVEYNSDTFCFQDKYLEAFFTGKQGFSKDYDSYKEAVHKFLIVYESIWNSSLENLYDALHLIRLKYYYEKEMLELRNQKLLTNKNSTLPPLYKDLNQEKFLDVLCSTKKSVLIAVGGYENLPIAIHKAQELQSKGIQIFFLVKENINSPLATKNDFQILLESEKSSLKLEDIKLIAEYTPGRGIDYSKIQYSKKLADALQKQELFLLGFGEDVLMSVHDLTIPAFVYSKNRGYYPKAILGVYSEDVQAGVYIPPLFSIFPFVPIVEKSKCTYLQMARFNNSSAPLDEELLKSNLPQALLKKGITLLSRYYDYDKCDFTSFPVMSNEFQNGVRVDGVVFEKCQAAAINQIYDYRNLSFEEYLKSNGLMRDEAIISNFMFFITATLVNKYNLLNKDRPFEKMSHHYHHMDYQKTKAVETFPLYNKPCIAHMRDNTFRIFRHQLSAGQLKIYDMVFAWEQKHVNSTLHQEEVLVYTPYQKREEMPDISLPNREIVGSNRINLVFVGQEIICIRNGDVLLPPFGVAVSLQEEIGLELVKKLRLTLLADGYYKVDDIPFTLKLSPPTQFSKEEWEDVQWVYGGGMFLIDNTIAVTDTPEGLAKSLGKEGWFSPLGLQTQESNIFESLRHPRTALGITKENHFFIMVFSGRSKLSAGADYKEMCTVARQLLGDNIKQMINVDGGASSFMALCDNQSVYTLSEPCASNDTCAGCLRQVPSFLSISF